MEVSVAVAGGDTDTVEVEPDDTYAALLAHLPLSVHEVSILVDGTPVPADQPIEEDIDAVRVVRLVQGG